MLRTFFAVSLSLSLVSCATGQMPEWEGEIWAGHSESASIRRNNEPLPQALECAHPKFNEYMSMSWEDFGCFIQTYVLNAKEWWDMNPQCTSVDPEQAKEYLRLYESTKGVRTPVRGSSVPVGR